MTKKRKCIFAKGKLTISLILIGSYCDTVVEPVPTRLSFASLSKNTVRGLFSFTPHETLEYHGKLLVETGGWPSFVFPIQHQELAAPRFAVFEAWAARTSTLMFIRHRHRARLRATYLEMPNRLHRYYGAGYLHFITTSCYQRRALLGARQHRDWSSFCDYAEGRRGLVLVNEPQKAELGVRKIA